MKNRWQRFVNIKKKWQKPVEKGEKADERRWLNRRQTCSSRRQHRSAQKRREWLHRSAQQRRSSAIYLGRKVLTYNILKSDTRVEQQTVELTTFRPEASSGKRNERQYEKAHEFMKKKGGSEVWKIGESEVWKIQKSQKSVERGEKADERRWFYRMQRCSSRRQHRRAQKRLQWLHRSA